MTDDKIDDVVDALDNLRDSVDRCASRLGCIVFFLYAPILFSVLGACVYLVFLLVVVNN